MIERSILLIGVLSMSPAPANEFEQQWRRASGETDVVAASASELQAMRDNSKRLLAGQAVPTPWEDLALRPVKHRDITMLREASAARRGRGFFAVKAGAAQPWLLQAPHGDTDLYTGKIAARLFLEAPFKAAQWNTVKRDASDLAHSPDSYWQAFTEAFAEQYPDGKIIQLHGFEQQTRKSKAGERSGMIVSAGHAAPPLWVQQTAACLKAVWPGLVSLYPFDVKELGGTTNVQGQLLQRLGHQGFLHIEMSKAMRQEWLEDVASRAALVKCL